MEFCKVCGSRLKPTKIRTENQALMVMSCSKCGQKQQETEYNLKFNGKYIQHDPKQLVAIIDKNIQQLCTMPTIKVECPNCGNNTANVWQVQTRGSDESSTQFIRCLRCGFTFRENT